MKLPSAPSSAGLKISVASQIPNSIDFLCRQVGTRYKSGEAPLFQEVHEKPQKKTGMKKLLQTATAAATEEIQFYNKEEHNCFGKSNIFHFSPLHFRVHLKSS